MSILNRECPDWQIQRTIFAQRLKKGRRLLVGVAISGAFRLERSGSGGGVACSTVI